MDECRDCQHWELNWQERRRPYPGWGNCAAIVGYDTVGQPEPRGVRMTMTEYPLDETGYGIGDDFTGPEWPADERYGTRLHADFWTAPDFGCNQFAPKGAR